MQAAAGALLMMLSGLVPAAFAQDLGTRVRIGGAPFSRSFSSASLPAASPVIFSAGPSDVIARPFDTVLMQGELPRPGLRLEVSRRPAGAPWSSWVRASPHKSPSGRFWARAEFSSTAAGALRLRAVAAGGAAVHTLTIYSMEVFSRTAAASSSGGPAIPAAPQSPGACCEKPAVIGRGDWGAKPPLAPSTPHSPVRFTQHHTAGRRTLSLADSIEEMRFIQDLHQNGRGWSDIGYHFLIDAAGRIFQGRPETVVGAHVRGRNSGNVGIALIGYHHPPYNHPVSPAQLLALKALGRWLGAVYSLSPRSYTGHRDQGPTACPGDILYGQLDRIRESFRLAPHEPVHPAVLKAPHSLAKGLGGARSGKAAGRVFDGRVSDR